MSRRGALRLLAAALAAGLVAACGRKGDPEPIDGRKDSYPRKYPSGPPPS